MRAVSALILVKQRKHRDVAARAFANLYRVHAAEFPSECCTSDHEERIQAAYPIHPEIFDRLYEDSSTLINFERPRGVLRLMAAVIHTLWENGDRNPLILPFTIPIDDPRKCRRNGRPRDRGISRQRSKALPKHVGFLGGRQESPSGSQRGNTEVPGLVLDP